MSIGPVTTDPRSHRLLLVVLASLSLALAWFWMSELSSRSTWYRNANMDAHNVIDALALNSGYPLGTVDQPAAPTKFLLALDFRVRNALGLQPVWTLKRFARSADPIRELAELVQIGRQHSRGLVILFILAAAAGVGQLTRRFDAACLAVILLSGSSGLLFQGMLLRPELLCALCGGVLAFQAAWLAVAATRPHRRTLWLFAAGVGGGLGVLAQLPAYFYLVVILLWCAFATRTPGRVAVPAMPVPHARMWVAILGSGTGLATLALLAALGPQMGTVTPVALLRLRLVAAAVAFLPLWAFVPTQNHSSRFGVDRLLDLSLLGGGLLAAFLGWLGLLCTILPAGIAAGQLAKIYQTTFNPEPLLQLYIEPGWTHQWHEALRYLIDRPALIVMTGLFTVGLALVRSVPTRWRLAVFLLWFQGAGMTLLVSRRGFMPQFNIFLEVPLLLGWCVGLTALHACWCRTQPAAEQRWPAVLVIAAAFILTLTMPLRLAPKYQSYRGDDGRQPNGLTLTFLYDHDAHPPAYLAAMKARYPNRAAFEAALERLLADPANQR